MGSPLPTSLFSDEMDKPLAAILHTVTSVESLSFGFSFGHELVPGNWGQLNVAVLEAFTHSVTSWPLRELHLTAISGVPMELILSLPKTLKILNLNRISLLDEKNLRWPETYAAVPSLKSVKADQCDGWIFNYLCINSLASLQKLSITIRKQSLNESLSDFPWTIPTTNALSSLEIKFEIVGIQGPTFLFGLHEENWDRFQEILVDEKFTDVLSISLDGNRCVHQLEERLPILRAKFLHRIHVVQYPVVGRLEDIQVDEVQLGTYHLGPMPPLISFDG